ncbi:hypothetical protein [Oceanobacter mangrovi]|uniref:hypothetical protein n=1 Tax=Oceanobacter mangrovi TaxID=2862510 RepID=UPI001C8D3568|nr:hypothetical protein [Oceanobacter mangrovi]
MTLHLIQSCNPLLIGQLADVADTSDALVLLGKSCLLASVWRLALPELPLFMRSKDAEVNGQPAAEGVQLLSDVEWVELTLSHNKTLSWID